MNRNKKISMICLVIALLLVISSVNVAGMLGDDPDIEVDEKLGSEGNERGIRDPKEIGDSNPGMRDHLLDEAGIPVKQYKDERSGIDMEKSSEGNDFDPVYKDNYDDAISSNWATPRSSVIFSEDFEDGNYDGWVDGSNPFTRQVTSSTAADGTTYSFTQTGGWNNHREGVSRDVGSMSPNIISFYVRSGGTSLADAYFVIRSGGQTPIFFYMRETGNFYANRDLPLSYSANTWYHVEFTGIDWVNHNFDVRVNGNLVSSNVGFRDNTASFNTIYLYNYHNSQAWWDEINLFEIAHDIEVTDITVPNPLQVYKNNMIRGTITNNGIHNEFGIAVELVVDGVVMDITGINYLGSGDTADVEMKWKPMSAGTYTVGLHAQPVPGEIIINNNWLNVTRTASLEPDIDVSPNGFNFTLLAGGTTGDLMRIKNTGYDDLVYEIYEGAFGSYIINQKSYDWIDGVSGGTPLYQSDDDYDSVPLPFDFQFYDQSFNSIYICSNGWASFTYASSSIPGNETIPNTNWDYTIFPIGDDWNPGAGGDVYYEHFTSPNRFVVTWHQVPHYGTGGTNTFQMVLYESGAIEFNYQQLETPYTYTIGVNQGDGINGTKWLKVPNDGESLLIDNINDVEWLDEDPQNGLIYPGSREYILLDVDASTLGPGNYSTNLIVYSNDPDEGLIYIPVNLTVVPLPHDIAVDSVNAPAECELGKQVNIDGDISNQGQNDENNVQVELYVDGVFKNSTTIPSLLTGDVVNVSMGWTPMSTGDKLVELYADPVAGETNTANNRKNTTVNVIANPDVWIDPHGFDFTVEKGKTDHDVLTIGNDGYADLDWNLSAGIPPSSINVALTTGNAAERGALETDLINLGFNVFSVNSVDDAVANNCDVIIDYPGTNTINDGTTTLNSYVSNGNGYIQFSDHGRDFISNAWEGIGYDTPVDVSTVDSNHPISYNIPSTYTSHGFWHNAGNGYVGWSTTGTSHDVMGVQASGYGYHSKAVANDTLGAGNLVYVGYGPYGADANSDDLQMVQNIVTFGATGSTSVQNIGWLDWNPKSGTISPLDQTNVDFTVDTSTLSVGNYHADLILTSNDPDENSIQIPVNLTVTPLQHDINVSNINAPATGYTGSQVTVDGTIENVGQNDETNIEVRLYVDGSMVNSTIIPSLLSGNSVITSLGWIPTSGGAHTLEIRAVPVPGETNTANNKMSTTIDITAVPDVWIDPHGFDFTVELGQTDSDTLTIGNDGIADLDWEICKESVVINEFNTGNPDWVEIYNYGPPVDMSDWEWYWQDERGYSGFYTIPTGFTLGTNSFVVIHETNGANGPTDLYMDSNMMWTSTSGGIAGALIDNSGNGVDYFRTQGSSDSCPTGTSWIVPDITEPITNDVGRRIHDQDTNSGNDWTVGGTATEGALNPGQSGNVLPPWLSVSPDTGIVSQFDQSLTTITVDTTSLFAGNYYANLSLVSNDPDESFLIPVNLTVIQNLPPLEPTNPVPANNSIGVNTNPWLSVDVADPNGDMMDVHFYNASDDSLIGTVSGVYNGTVSVQWFGLNEIMNYTWYAVADDGSNTNQSDTWNFTTGTDNQPPTVVSHSPTGVDVARTANIVIKFNESMDIVSVNNSFSYTDGTTTWDGSDGTISWNPSNTTMTFDPHNNLAYGTPYNVTFDGSIAADIHGNNLDGDGDGTSEGSPDDDFLWNFTTENVDTTDPSVSITSPEDGAIVNSATVTVEWSSSDAQSGIDHNEYRLDSGTWVSVGSSTSHTFDSLDEGEHTVDIRATNGRGLTSTDTVTFTVDSITPEVTITAPEDSSTIDTANTTVEWDGDDDGTGIDHYEISIDGSTWEDVGTDTSYDLEDLDDGDHEVEVKAVDGAGNENITSVEFTVDTTAPELTITKPSHGSYQPADVTVRWNGDDDTSGIDYYEVRMDGGQWIYVGTNESYEFTSISEGTHTVEVRAVDLAGNEIVESRDFEVDATPPTATGSPTGTDVDVDTTVTVTFSEEMKESTVDIEVKGVIGTTELVNNTLTFTPNADLSFTTQYHVYVNGSDMAGNAMSTYHWTFTTSANKGTVSGTVIDEDGDPVSGATVTLDSGETVTTDENGNFEIEANPGTFTITISKDGYKDKTMEVTLDPGEQENRGEVVLPEKEEGALPFTWLLLLILAVIIIIILVIVAKRKKPEEQPPPPMGPQETYEEPMEEESWENEPEESWEEGSDAEEESWEEEDEYSGEYHETESTPDNDETSF